MFAAEKKEVDKYYKCLLVPYNSYINILYIVFFL